jgi:hypothetical protein
VVRGEEEQERKRRGWCGGRSVQESVVGAECGVRSEVCGLACGFRVKGIH